MSAESEVTTTARRCDEEWHYFAKDAMQCACGDRLRVTGGIAPFAVPRSRSELRRIAVQKGESLPDFVAASSESVPEVPPSVMDELVGRVCQRLEKGFYARNFQEAEDDARALRAEYLASCCAVSSSPTVRTDLPCRHCGAGEAIHEPMLGTCPSLDDGVYDAVDAAAPSVPAETPPKRCARCGLTPPDAECATGRCPGFDGPVLPFPPQETATSEAEKEWAASMIEAQARHDLEGYGFTDDAVYTWCKVVLVLLGKIRERDASLRFERARADAAHTVHLLRHRRLSEAVGIDPGFSADATIDKAISRLSGAQRDAKWLNSNCCAITLRDGDGEEREFARDFFSCDDDFQAFLDQLQPYYEEILALDAINRPPVSLPTGEEANGN